MYTLSSLLSEFGPCRTDNCVLVCVFVCVCGGGDAEVQKQLKQTRLLRAGLVGNPHSAVDKQAFVFRGREVTH